VLNSMFHMSLTFMKQPYIAISRLVVGLFDLSTIRGSSLAFPDTHR